MNKTTKEYFLDRVESYCERTGMKENVLCAVAMGNLPAGGFMKRFREGKGNMSSVHQIEKWMADHPDGV